MVLHYLAQVGVSFALGAILVISWLLARQMRRKTGAWLRFVGALLLVIVRLTDIMLFDPFVGILHANGRNSIEHLWIWSRVFSVGAAAGLMIFACGEIVLYSGSGHSRHVEGTE